MAAVVHPTHQLQLPLPEPVARWFAAEPAAERAAPARPPLRVIPGGREAVRRLRRPPEVYRRRRLTVALSFVTLVASFLFVGANLAGLTATTGAPSQASDGSAAVVATPSAPISAPSYLVQPGDSLWSIAERLRPGADPRPLVDRLADRAGPGALQAGQRLDLTGLVDG